MENNGLTPIPQPESTPVNPFPSPDNVAGQPATIADNQSATAPQPAPAIPTDTMPPAGQQTQNYIQQTPDAGNYTQQPMNQPALGAGNYTQQPMNQPAPDAGNYTQQPMNQPAPGADNYAQQPMNQPAPDAGNYMQQPMNPQAPGAGNYMQQPMNQQAPGTGNYTQQPVGPNYGQAMPQGYYPAPQTMQKKSSKKWLIIAGIAVVVVAALVVVFMMFGNKKPITTEQFVEIAAKNGLQAEDITYELTTDEAEFIKGMGMAGDDTIHFEFYQYLDETDSTANEHAFYNYRTNLDEFKEADIETNSRVEINLPGYHSYKITNEYGYFRIIHLQDTFVYIWADKDQEQTAEKIVKEMGY